ncbi:MAG: transglutaminase-like domain-containing protein [Verrucomicrobiota bacterium]
MNPFLPRVILASLLLLGTAIADIPLPEETPPPEKLTAHTRSFIEKANETHGLFGKKAASFLVSHMPQQDRETLTTDFLMENLRLALETRERFPWAKNLPDFRFFNDVLPYAVLDETRDGWRKTLLPKAAALVKDCTTASEAAQRLNEKLFHLLNVHYNTNRQRPNQSPEESITQGRATCTGLAIVLVDACRSVGIPARVAGTAEWTNKRGNHTWVEIWDGEWKFTGADEFDAKGLNRGWFAGDAAKAIANDPIHAIWASSWKPVDGSFPMVWAPESRNVGAVNVTARYTGNPAGKSDSLVHLRVLESPARNADNRIVVTAELCNQAGEVIASQPTKAGTADLNDMAAFQIKPGHYLWRLKRGNEIKETPLTIDTSAERTIELHWETLPSPPPPAL